MMIEQARVLAYENGIARVQSYAKQGCGSCASSGCGTSALSGLSGEKKAPIFEIKVAQALNAGDQIEIGLSEKALLISIFLLYGVPLFVLVASSLLLSPLFDSELWLASTVLAVVLLTFKGLHHKIKTSPTANFKPIFIRKL